MSRVATRVCVAGRVQGVGFRWWTRRAAQAQGVRGWVRNLVDGRVEAHLEGAPADVSALLEQLHAGPSASRVSAVEVREAPGEDRKGFEILPTAHS